MAIEICVELKLLKGVIPFFINPKTYKWIQKLEAFIRVRCFGQRRYIMPMYLGLEWNPNPNDREELYDMSINPIEGKQQ